MEGTYNWTLVAASYCVAVVAAYTAIYFGTRVFDLSGESRKFWLAAGGFCLGSGIWSMHFVGMSAYSMPMGMDMSFSASITLLSWVPAVFASVLAIYVITLPMVTFATIAASAFIMGSGIFAMHYTGMFAMKMDPSIHYNIPLVILSGVIAVVASGAALLICRKVRVIPRDQVFIVKMVAALVMGAAICGMHYTGMAAVSFPAGSEAASDNWLRGDWMGIPTAVAASIFLLLSIYVAYTDFREIERVREEKLRLNRAAEKVAFYDSVTGLGNRNYLESRIQERIQKYLQGEKNEPFSLLYFELDEYRKLMRIMPPAALNKLAAELAARFRRQLSGKELIVRYSNNSYFIKYPKPLDKGSSLLKGIIAELNKPVYINAKIVSCNWSFGYSQYPASGNSARSIILAAQNSSHRNGLHYFRHLSNGKPLRASGSLNQQAF